MQAVVVEGYVCQSWIETNYLLTYINTVMSTADLSSDNELVDKLSDMFLRGQQVDTWPDVLDEAGPRDHRKRG